MKRTGEAFTLPESRHSRHGPTYRNNYDRSTVMRHPGLCHISRGCNATAMSGANKTGSRYAGMLTDGWL